MKLTVAEAENLPCPFNQAPCTGPGCPLWRWSRAKETAEFLEEVKARMLMTGELFGRAANNVFKERPGEFDHVVGYCGAGGKPE